GTRVNVERLRPCPPASAPCATMMSAPASTAVLACSMFCTWQISLEPAALTAGANGAGVPNDNIMAAGECANAICSNSGCLASDQVLNPQPTRALPAAVNSRCSHAPSP